MGDIVFNQHLREIFRQVLQEEDTHIWTAKEILFNSYGLIVFNEEIMSIKKRNKVAHGR